MNFTPIFEKELKTLIEDEFLLFQKLPNIPDYVADDIKEFRENHMKKAGAFSYEDYINSRTKKWLMDIRNQLPFMQALSTGKYQSIAYYSDVFYLKNTITGDFLMRKGNTLLEDSISALNPDPYIGLFTFQEIENLNLGSYKKIYPEDMEK